MRNAMPFADRLEITEVHAKPGGDTRLAAIDAAQWEEVTREQASLRGGRQRHLFPM